MGLKRGYVVDEDTPGTRGESRIRRFRLDNGDHVYLPLDIAAALIGRHSPAEEFFFVEKGLLGRTCWAGNLHDLRVALGAGILASREVGGLELPVRDEYAGWTTMIEEDDHQRVGGYAPVLAETLRRHGRHEQADALTIPAWLDNSSKNGWCLANRADNRHGHVWCGRTDPPTHEGPHLPVCPVCQTVKTTMLLVSRAGGRWL